MRGMSDVTGLVHIIIAVIDNLLKAADGIRDFFHKDPLSADEYFVNWVFANNFETT